MIHTANEFTAQHHRYLVSGTVLGLHSLAGGASEAGATAAEGEKGGSARRAGISSPSSKASTAFALTGSRRGAALLLCMGVVSRTPRLEVPNGGHTLAAVCMHWRGCVLQALCLVDGIGPRKQGLLDRESKGYWPQCMQGSC
jgi:hypothetical protein